MAMAVYWTVKAKRQLRGALAGKLCRHRRLADPTGTSNPPPEDATCATFVEQQAEELNQLLERTFPDAEAIAVQDQMLGFRRKENMFVLLVDVFGGDKPGAYVVKIGPRSKLQHELQNWNACRPEGLRHDLVLLPLSAGCESAGGEDALMTLVYGSAHQFIGVERVVPLEEAVLNAVVLGAPKMGSVDSVFGELYERLGHLLYCQSSEECPTNEQKNGQPIYVLDIPHLDECLELWSTGSPGKLRTLANGILQEETGPTRFLDPVNYLRYARQFVHWEDRNGDIHSPVQWDEPPPGVPIPELHQVVPCVAVGSAHGDLHGRNVLVGQVHGRVLWPTVFDYEDMGPCNLIGWDFVKMEMELKIRAYPQIFRQLLTKEAATGERELLFVESVQLFEERLDIKTEGHHRNDLWPTAGPSDDPERRLRTALLSIRQRAALHLGLDLGRAQRWLEEYYFLLACYGVCTVRYSNLQDKERIAAYVSAGVAAARLSWPREFEAQQRDSETK